MNLNQLAGSVRQLGGILTEQWGNAINSDAQVGAGRRAQLRGRIQQSQGDVREASRKQLRQWEQAHDDWCRGLTRPR